MMVTVVVLTDIAPKVSVPVSVTVYLPGAEYKCCTTAPVAVPLSPKFHWNRYGGVPPLPLAVNVTGTNGCETVDSLLAVTKNGQSFSRYDSLPSTREISRWIDA